MSAPPIATIQTSYNGGEISQRLFGRVDQGIYAISVEECFNFVPTVEGPAAKRPGFAYIRGAMASASWLSPFQFSRTQAYIIEWGEGTLRFYTNGGRIESDPVTPYEVTVPYTAAEAPFVSAQQSYDRLYLWHPSHAPAALTRNGALTFGYDALNLVNGPFADQNSDESVTVTLSGTLTLGGTATITATSAIFVAGHVGSAVQVEAEDFNDLKAWEAGMDGIVVNTTRVRSDGKAYLAVAAVASNRTGSIQPTHSRGDAWDGQGGSDVNTKGPYGVLWRYQHDRFGEGVITAIGGGGTTATVTVTRRFPSSLAATASHRWSLAAISAAAGWPKCGLIAFGRMIMFTDFEMICSVVGDYGGGSVNLAELTESGLLAPDMAFRRRLDISNPVLWAIADRDSILVGTVDGEYAIRKVNAAAIFSSDNVECVPQSRYGAAEVRPAQTGTSTLFVQKSGRKLREAGYDLQSDRYVAPNIAVWQRHILKSGAKQLTFQQEPEEMLWAVRNDGVLVLHPHVPEQDVKGFARAGHAAGAVLSAVSSPTMDGTSDELWVLVDGGTAGKSVEQQQPFWEEGESALEDGFFVDSGVAIADPDTLTITASWLANREVAILADGGVLPRQTADGSGTFTLPLATPPAKLVYGLPYEARLKWLRPELRAPDGGTIQGKVKRLVRATLRVLETCLVQVDPGNGRRENLIDRPGSAAMDAPVPPFTGDVGKSVSGGWDRDGQGTIVSADPVPCMVVAHLPTLTVGER